MRRLLSVLEHQLARDTRPYVLEDEYTIVDMAIYPWARGLEKLYEANEFLGVDSIPTSGSMVGSNC